MNILIFVCKIILVLLGIYVAFVCINCEPEDIGEEFGIGFRIYSAIIGIALASVSAVVAIDAINCMFIK